MKQEQLWHIVAARCFLGGDRQGDFFFRAFHHLHSRPQSHVRLSVQAGVFPETLTVVTRRFVVPSKIEWDLTNGPLTKLLELLDTKV